MIEPEVIYDKLSDMKADEIADYLESQGVRGRQNYGNSCAISMYFLTETGKYIFVGYEGVFEYDRSTLKSETGVVDALKGGYTSEQFPYEVRKFMSNFDNGHYPNLIAKDNS